MVRVLGPGSEREPIAFAETTGIGPRYQFKTTLFSGHTPLRAEFPLRGKGLRVPDIGCASGHLAELLAARGFEATGVDSPGALHAPGDQRVDVPLPPTNMTAGFLIERPCASIYLGGRVELLARAGFHLEAVRSPGVRLSFELARVWKTMFAYQFIVRAGMEL